VCNLVPGPDGNIWFAEYNSSHIARITPGGVITEIPTPRPDSAPCSMTVGPDGALWFSGGFGIMRMTLAGVFTEFLTNGASMVITGPDGNIWFIESTAGPDADAHTITKMSLAGTILAQYPVPRLNASQVGPTMTAGPDGNIWFIEYVNNNKLGRLELDGTYTEFPLPDVLTQPGCIVAGLQGMLLFCADQYYPATDWIGRITTDGVISKLPVNSFAFGVNSITVGPDGNVWFIEQSQSIISRMTPSGTMMATVGIGGSIRLNSITVGPDGNIWFSESPVESLQHSVIGRLTIK